MIRGTKRIQGRRAGLGMGWGSLEGEDLGSWSQDQQYFQCLSVSVGSWQQDELRRKARVLGGKSGCSRDPAAAESSCLGEVREEARGEAWGPQRVLRVPRAPRGSQRVLRVPCAPLGSQRVLRVPCALWGSQRVPPCPMCSTGIAAGPPCPTCSTQ